MKNIALTLCERQQMRAASIYFRGMFNTEDYTVPEQDVLYKKDLVTGNEDVLTK